MNPSSGDRNEAHGDVRSARQVANHHDSDDDNRACTRGLRARGVAMRSSPANAYRSNGDRTAGRGGGL